MLNNLYEENFERDNSQRAQDADKIWELMGDFVLTPSLSSYNRAQAAMRDYAFENAPELKRGETDEKNNA